MGILRLSHITKETLRVISIDPGGGKAGYAVVELNFETKKFKVLHMETRTGDSLMNAFFDKVFIASNDERMVKNMAHAKYLALLLNKYEPDLVAIEGAYAFRPATYRSLVEHSTFHRAAVHNYDPFMEFAVLPASVVKKAIGVKGNSGDKTLITKALVARKKVDLDANGFKFQEQEEHANDAVAIGMTACLKAYSNMTDKIAKPKGKKKKSKKRTKKK